MSKSKVPLNEMYFVVDLADGEQAARLGYKRRYGCDAAPDDIIIEGQYIWIKVPQEARHDNHGQLLDAPGADHLLTLSPGVDQPGQRAGGDGANLPGAY